VKVSRNKASLGFFWEEKKGGENESATRGEERKGDQTNERGWSGTKLGWEAPEIFVKGDTSCQRHGADAMTRNAKDQREERNDASPA